MISRMCAALGVVRRQRHKVEKPAHPVVRRTIAREGTTSAITHEITRKPATGTPSKTLAGSVETIYAGRKHLYDPPKTCSLREHVLHGSGDIYMAIGNVKWFNPTKGYGFIQPQGGGQDVFVHISAVERAGLTTLNEGQQVEFEIVSNRGKSSAENLKVK